MAVEGCLTLFWLGPESMRQLIGMMSQCFVIRWCNSIILHGEERYASKKNTVRGESSEFCVCGKFNCCEWVGRNSLTLARMIIYMHHFPWQHFCWSNLHHSSVWIEKVSNGAVTWRRTQEILLVLPIVFNRVIRERIIYLVKVTWTSISSPTCGPPFLQSAPGGRYLDSPETTKE
jgi:hypothetical protein